MEEDQSYGKNKNYKKEKDQKQLDYSQNSKIEDRILNKNFEITVKIQKKNQNSEFNVRIPRKNIQNSQIKVSFFGFLFFFSPWP